MFINRVNKLWYNHTVEKYAAIKEHKLNYIIDLGANMCDHDTLRGKIKYR